MRVHRSIEEPPRPDLSWTEKWKAADGGLIACWERGRQKSVEDASLASKARAGQLVILPWRGGVEKPLKSGRKFGSLNYLAMWQGLRGDDLDIDTDAEVCVVCAVTNQPVTFTNDVTKYAEP